MKRLIALSLALLMLFALAACGGGDTPATQAPASDTPATDVPATDAPAADSDKQYILDKGTLVVGITDFAPMDYQDQDGNWIGFDADLAKAFAERLGVEAKFQIITDWDAKVMELEGKTVDVVWNGMTLTDDVKAAMECSVPYCANSQIVVLPVDQADNYPTAESMKDLTFAVENGSAGQEAVEALGYATVPTQDQGTALLEVSAGTADAAVIDSLMAAAMVGEGTDFAQLTYTIGLCDEEYGVGFRKGSDLAAELNDFFKEVANNGVMAELAHTYGVDAAILPQK